MVKKDDHNVHSITSENKLGATANCQTCQEGVLTGFRHNFSERGYDPKFKKVIQSLIKLKDLRHGALYTCKACNAFWYFDPKENWVGGVSKDRIQLIDDWDKHEILLSDELVYKLEEIGETPTDLYGNGRQYKEVPCGVVTDEGENIDVAIIVHQKNAPYESHRDYRLASEIVDIYESPYALPFDVRVATTQAQEVRMMFAPTYIKFSDENFFILNWTTNFLKVKRFKARDAQLVQRYTDIPDNIITNDNFTKFMPKDPTVVYFIAD